MHIKKLEISGFKSFVDRTVIPFDHDLIGIVGPNGCGKSNVVDAIRWAMGEQSAKALRGRAMADVIFNGSESRAPHGFAEVTLTFDNTEPQGAQRLPLEYRDYSEIAVTRRLYRDSTSEYLINKVPVRLRDVTDVFLGTGVGRKAYSIVEQGKIGLIVSARPEDRRLLIEEAAGITKYKARKRQAEQKMQQTRHNLTRVADIVAELERQLASLKRQAAKAQRFLRYRDELDDLLLWEASHKLLEYIVTLEVAERERAQAGEQVQARRAEVDAQEAQVEVLRQTAQDAEQHAEQAQNAAFSSDNLVREHDARIERSADRLALLDERLQTARVEQLDLEGRAAELATERDELAAQAEDAEAEQTREEVEVQAEANTLVDREAASDRAQETLIGLRRREAQAAATVAGAEATIGGFQQRREEMVGRRDRLQGEQTTLAEQADSLEVQRDERASHAQALAARHHAMRDARDALDQGLPALREAQREHEQVVDRRRAELHDDRSRLQALEELAARLEGVEAGVRHLLQTEDSALEGLIANRIDVPDEITPAFAGVVGQRLQCVLVSDVDRGLALLHELGEQGHGRATILPAQPRRIAGAQCDVPDGEGVLGPLVDHLSFDAADDAAVRALVGGALLVQSEAHARQLCLAGVTADLVTLEGTVFHADGRISGGNGDCPATGILEQKRELERLAEAMTGRRDALEQASAHHDELREQMRKHREALDQASREAHDAEIELLKGQQDLEQAEQQLSTVHGRQQQVERELAELTAALQTTGDQHQQAEAALAAGRAEVDTVGELLVESEQVAQGCRNELAEQQRIFTERKVLFAQVRERAHSARAAFERVHRSYDELRERIDGLEQERHDAATESGQLAAAIVLGREQLLEAKRDARDAHSLFEGARGELDDLRHRLGLREAELRELRAELAEASERLQKHEMEHQRLTLERSHLEDGVRERFRGLELATIAGDYHARPMVDDQHRARIKELNHLIDRMGSVNLDAAKELAESSERFDHYTEQQQDLTQALDDLEKAISQMNRESRRLFKRAFEGINAEFQTVFPKLFHGGKAELRLTQPEDLLETGIEILAQPPGKKLGNIELMSGGEKAFTAVALLMAIFNFKPSPFCILDEVDAPLDEANVVRYIENIRGMTERSQFIVITHSKRTMQAVDVLYGVTMQEPGVSKLVGVRVDQSAQSGGLTRSERLSHRPPPPAASDEDAALAS